MPVYMELCVNVEKQRGTRRAIFRHSIKNAPEILDISGVNWHMATERLAKRLEVEQPLIKQL